MSDPSAAIIAMADRFRLDGLPSGAVGLFVPRPVPARVRPAAPVPPTMHG